ncbi:MAG TPA: hypothetical protein VII28_07925, partial [Puia sp.]
FFIICFVYKSQPRITLNGGKGWDGLTYYSMTEQIHAGSTQISGVMPHVRRLGTPLLIAWFSQITGINIIESALYVNLTGALITVLLLFLWLRNFFVKFWITALLCFLFMMAWYAPVRYSFYVPLTTDPWGAVWLVWALILMRSMRNCRNQKREWAFIVYLIIYSLVISIGNLFRESNAVLCILPLFIVFPIGKLKIDKNNLKVNQGFLFIRRISNRYFVWKYLYVLIPFLCIAVSNLYIKKHVAVSDRNLYSYTENILTCIYTKTVPEYILGILTAFGPLILLVPLYFHRFKSILLEKQELLVLLIISLLFGYIGGTDTERILCMSGFPVILLILGSSIEGLYYSSQRWWIYVLFILQTLSMRFYWNLPDYSIQSGHTPVPFFGLLSDHVKYLYLYSHWSNYLLSTILLTEYLILFMATWYIVHNKIVLKLKSP